MSQLNRCLLCSRPGGSLCHQHEKRYVIDLENNWIRKKQRLQSDVRKQEKKRKYHNTETKLIEILKIIFGKNNVVVSVHPLWAFSTKNVLLEFDICVPCKKLMIEYDGIQHFERSNFFHKTHQDFEDQKARDVLKDQLAKENGWNLLRIKYTVDVTYGNIYNILKKKGYLLNEPTINIKS